MAIEFQEPREVHPLETDTHLYRVGFWWHQEPPPGSGTPKKKMGWGVELWDLAAEDVHEVIEWAEEKARSEGSIYTLYVRLEGHHADGGDLLVRIAGADPTTNPDYDDGFQRRHPHRQD